MSDRAADATLRIACVGVRAGSPAGVRTPDLDEFRDDRDVIWWAHAPFSRMIPPVAIGGELASI
jgi:hypothetical protein